MHRMERPTKRRKHEDNHARQSEQASFVPNEDTEYRHVLSQGSNQFEGQGISNRNGNIDIGGDFIGTVFSLTENLTLC
jgi:hypothetical protein